MRCRGELPNIRGMFSALRYFDISSNVVGGFIPQAWADTGIIRLVRYTDSLAGPPELCALRTAFARAALLLQQCSTVVAAVSLWKSMCSYHARPWSAGLRRQIPCGAACIALDSSIESPAG